MTVDDLLDSALQELVQAAEVFGGLTQSWTLEGIEHEPRVIEARANLERKAGKYALIRSVYNPKPPAKHDHTT